ncbi:MAG: hypothetical protein HY231_20885 [Acidobacteria bacterium]|nr:hypothetical protein [Acidobacteriota bacterium]
MSKASQKTKSVIEKIVAALAIGLVVVMAFARAEYFAQAFVQSHAAAPANDLQITLNLADHQTLLPNDKIELRLSRELKKSEGRLAILIGQTDLTSLFTPFQQTLTYNRKILPLPVGENALTVYLVSPAEEWREIVRFTLRVANQKPGQQTPGISESQIADNPEKPATETPNGTTANAVEKAAKPSANDKPSVTNAVTNQESATTTNATNGAPPANPTSATNGAPPATTTSATTNASSSTANASSTTTDAATASPASTTTTAQAEPTGKRGGFDKLDFTPSLTIGYKSQAAESHFPATNRPSRPTFSDVTVQGSFKSEAARGIFISQNQFDIAGSSFQQEALRFGQLGNDAPRLDLASYLMQFQISKAKFLVGHTAYGTNRLLVNSFSSRGITMTLPLPQGLDLTLAAMNGTSIVGIENFFGLSNRQHQILGGTLGVEFIKSRPSGLRLEATYFSGYVQALNSVSQSSINDVERSRGLGFRILASDPKQRLRVDGGFARSVFINPADPLVNQGLAVVEVPNLARNARYLEAGFDILKDVEVTKTRKATLTFNYRHETVDPLYRSLGASTQADKTQNQFELIGNVGEILAQFSLIRFHDNLRDVPSILKSLSRAERFSIGAPLTAIFGDANQPKALLPRVSYTLDRIHQFGAALPINGGFEIAPEAIPDFLGTNQSFTSDWQLNKLRLGYRFNHSVQNNQQRGREQADLFNFVHAISTGINATKTLDLNFEFSMEQARSIENQRTDRTFRFANSINWRITQHNLLATNLSHTLLGDTAKTNRNRNLELDVQWSYQFTIGKEKFKKLQGQAFIRYANRYAKARDFAFGLDTRTKAQTLNIGMSFTFF